MEKVFEYNGSPVTFNMGNGSTMINATEMAKPFGKRPIDWLRIDSAKSFLEELAKVKKCTLEELVKTEKGGANPGTWMHKDVAMEFARWLAPLFAIWCNDRIEELITTGHTEMRVPTLEEALEGWLVTVKENKKLLTENTELKATIEEQKDDVAFSKAIQICEGGVYVKDLASILTQNGIKIGQNRLFALLRERGYLCTREGFKNAPAQKYLEQKLFRVKLGYYTDPRTGVGHQTQTTMVTGKGQKYFVNLFLGEMDTEVA